MKKFKSMLILPLVMFFLLVFSSIGVEAKGSSFSSGGSRSSSSSSRSSSSSSRSSSSSSSKPSTSSSKPSTSTSSKPSSSTSSSSKPSSSSGASSGFKSGSYSSSSSPSTPKSSTSGTTSSPKSSSFSNSTKNTDTSSPALKSIPKTYSNYSVNNHYYYHDTGSGYGNFWSNYWLYRAMTPDNRTYVSDGGTRVVAPAYGGFTSILWDLITSVLLIGIIGAILYYTNRRFNWVRSIKNKFRR